jgi:hypothetical protein
MTVTLRGRIVSGDNIAVGSASGVERTISGAAPPTQKVGGLDNVASGAAFPTTVIADDQQVGVPSLTREKVGNQ